MIRIIYAEDHAMVRKAIARELNDEEDIEVIAEAENGEEALSLLNSTSCDVLLLDLNMPKVDGLEVLRRIQEKNMHIKSIVLTEHNEPEYILKIKDLGAAGFVVKDSEVPLLIEAIHTVAKGGTYIQKELAESVYYSNFSNDPDADKILSLTSREHEIIREIANGLLNREIGEKLHISERTVKNHVSSILKKLDLNDRTQVAMFAVKHKMVERNAL